MTRVEPWTVVDSVLALKAVAFALSFDLDIDRTTNVMAYNAAGLDGHTAVFQDLFPFAPFNQASPVIDATQRPVKPGSPNAPSSGAAGVPEAAARLAADYLERAQQAPMIVDALNRTADRGSNSWVIGGRHTASGRPILASDRTWAWTARPSSTRSNSRAAASTPRATESPARRTSSSARTGTSRSARLSTSWT